MQIPDGSARETLVDILRERAAGQPDRRAYTFLTQNENEESSFTWSEIDLRARAVGAWLSSACAQGERVLLLSPSGPGFVFALFGCLYSGAVAVPAYPLDPARLERTLARLRGIVKDSSPAVALTSASSLGVVEDLAGTHPELRGIRWMAVESISLDLANDWKCPTIDTGTLAILQYTSGSVAAPKGVMVSHGNVMANAKMLEESHGYSEANTFVGWIPLAHDWGLIHNILQPLYLGAASVLMPTEAFLQKPVRWLQAISRYKNVTSGGPPFAYEYCIAVIPPADREGLNLDNWSYAGVGASPVPPGTLERFAAAFHGCGFRASAFYCGYGLAEATLLVSDSERFREPRVLRVHKGSLERNEVVTDPLDDAPACRFVSCGKAPSTEKVVIADPVSSTACPPGMVGEIWVSGGNVAQGYWNNPEETSNTFRAFLKESGEGPFLRTGDLGFFDSGELFVTGRLKDLIIICGRNIYPDDVELTVARCHKALRPGGTVAFSVQAEFVKNAVDESLVIVQEVRSSQQSNPADIFESIREAVWREHEVVAHAIVLVQERSTPKTSSGKLQRQGCRAAWLSGDLAVLQQDILGGDRVEHRKAAAFLAPHTPVEKVLAGIWSEVLKVEKIGIDDWFFDLGGDSSTAAECAGRLQAAFAPKQFSAEIFLYAPTIAGMAKAISDPASFAAQDNDLLPTRSDGAGVPLVLIFPGMEYWNLEARLGSNRRVLGIPPTGIDRLPAPHTVEQIASECVNRLRRHASRGPYALGGWCESGIVALEMARQLEECGEQVAFVALFDARSDASDFDPRDIFLPPMSQPRRSLVRSWRFARRIAFSASRPRRHGVSPGRESEILIAALQRYQPKPWSGRILHFCAAERPGGEIRGRLSPSGFVFHEVPGDCASMLRAPNIETISEILASELELPEAPSRSVPSR